MLILLIAFSLALLDQSTKYLIRNRLDLGDSVAVIDGFFNIGYVRNSGAAWGMLAGFGTGLIVLSVVMLIVLVAFRKHFITDTLPHRIATGLMLAGIVGNLIDRVRLGYVVDFLHFYWRQHSFPSFNVADSAICVGVVIYMISQMIESRAGKGLTDSASTDLPGASDAPIEGGEESLTP